MDEEDRPLSLGNRHDTSSCSVSERSIYTDLMSLNLPEDVIEQSELYFQRLNITAKKGSRRNQILFVCIYNAYKLLNCPQDAGIVANICGLDKSKINKAIKNYCDPESDIIYVEPENFLQRYIRELNLSTNDENNIYNIMENIKENHLILLEEFPQILSLAIVKYYLDQNRIEYDKNKFSEVSKQICNRSDMTISKATKKVAKALGPSN